jgi:regulator of replication initiation timing
MESRTELFHILDGHTVSVEDLQNENKVIYDQLSEWKKSYENLELQTRKLHQEMQQALKEKDREILELSTQNEELRKHIEKLQNSTLKYKGKDISEVQKKDKITGIIYVTYSSCLVVCGVIWAQA